MAPEVVRRLQLVARIFAGALGRKAAEEALRESEERLQLAAESAGIGLWRMDLATSAFWFTREAGRQIGVPEGAQITLEEVLERVDSRDRQAISAAVAVALESGNLMTVDYRLAGPDDGERWLLLGARIRGGASGEPESLMGVTLDVTEEAGRDRHQEPEPPAAEGPGEERALLARELHDSTSAGSRRLSAWATWWARTNPPKCVDLIIDRCEFCICGNHDHAVFYEPFNFNVGAERACYWTRQNLEDGARRRRS